ncbi:MAG TPA: tetratricopeptide repeat protein, partial [Bacteroidia bacterium]|nr:tetratricopeptide repeat protein [Bacteroidia bacterium]
LQLEEEIEDKQGITNCLVNLGQVFIKLNKPKEAGAYLNRALQLSIETGDKEAIKETYGGLVIVDSTMSNYKAAFEHTKLYFLYSDSLSNEETKKKSLQASMQYEFDKKEIAARAEQDKLDAIHIEEKKKQRIIIYAVAGLLLLVAVFAIFMFNRFRITNRQKVIIEMQKQRVDKAYEELHEKNKEVMDSIRYAKRIQTALITSEKYIQNAFTKLMKKNG